MHKWLFFLALFFFSCSKDNVQHPGNEPDKDSPVFNVNKSELLQRVNAVRLSGCNCGTTRMPPVQALNWNDQLATASYDHSLDMNNNDFFSHTGSNGSNTGQRLSAAGYPWRSYGENIAAGYQNEQAVVDGWLRSEGHCRNIMNAGVKEMGVGRGGTYWTQVLASR